MSQLAFDRGVAKEKHASDWQYVCRLGGIVAWIQLGLMLLMIVSIFALGWFPETVAETFMTLQNDGLAGVLRLDMATLLMIALFPFLGIGLYVAVRERFPAYGLLTLVLVLVGTVLSLANESALSMIYLSRLHAAAPTAAVQGQLLAAGEAILAGNLWNSTAGFFGGIFMQGSLVFISFVMLRHEAFSKWTAYSGILSNGLDFLHLFVGLFLPTVGTALISISGVFYVAWFILLGRDLIRISRTV